MNIGILFINIGYYHYARLAAASDACAARGWQVVGIQVTDRALEHPWGSISGGQVPIVTMDTRIGSHTASNGEIPAVSLERIYECLEEIRADVIFLPGWSNKICRQCLTWSRKQSIPVVLMNESKFDDEPRFWLKEWLKAALYVRHFGAALVGGAAHGEYAESLGIHRERIFTGYDIVDNAHFENGADRARHDRNETRKAFRGIPNRPYFIAASRMVRRKNIVALIRAYREHLNNAGNASSAWDLVVCGSGPQLDAIRREVNGFGLDDFVHLPGFLPYSEMPAWYGLAGAFVHPALQEQWGLVVNEACASGLPVIVSRTVGARFDLVDDGKNGFLVDPTSIDDIAEKLTLLHRSSEETLRKMGAYSRKLVQKLSPEHFGEGVINAVLSLRGRKA